MVCINFPKYRIRELLRISLTYFFTNRRYAAETENLSKIKFCQNPIFFIDYNDYYPL